MAAVSGVNVQCFFNAEMVALSLAPLLVTLGERLDVYKRQVNTLENRLKAKVCELCGTTESDHYEVHHINKLKNLKGKERWEIAMIAKHRKTLVVCRDCHRSIIHKK